MQTCRCSLVEILCFSSDKTPSARKELLPSLMLLLGIQESAMLDLRCVILQVCYFINAKPPQLQRRQVWIHSKWVGIFNPSLCGR